MPLKPFNAVKAALSIPPEIAFTFGGWNEMEKYCLRRLVIILWDS